MAIPVLAAVLLAGCASTPKDTNKAPSVVGVKDIQCMVNSTVDFLDGVAALDKEDGDITPELEITVTPQVEVNGGYAYFTEVGEYTVNYKITDSNGRTAQKRAYVDVVDRETYKTFAMPEGFSAQADGSATIEKCGMESGAFKLEAKGGEIAEDVKLTRTFVLPRAYSTTNYIPYTFIYSVNSDVAGKVKALADGEDCAEMAVKIGENALTFTHAVRKTDEDDANEITIDICLGGLGDVKWTVGKVEIEYPQEDGTLKELAENFNFAGKVSSRFDTNNGAIKLEGNTWAGEGGKTACLKITEACDDIWRGGMFINTGIALKAGVTYTVSFKAERDEENAFEVILTYEQWVLDFDKVFKTFYSEVGEIEHEITVPEGKAGSLWFYVQAGNAVNEIRISDLSVKEHLGPVGVDTYAIDDFTEEHADGCNSTLTTDMGSFTYLVETFGGDYGANQVKSPSFLIAGSSANYVISFKAKASAPIQMVVVAPVYGGWEPTILWQSMYIGEEETIFTFYCNGSASDTLYRLVWQFGSASNQQYDNVKIEISDIKVSLKNSTLDG